MSERATVAVIGAGFSGVLTAVRLLLDPEGPRVLLIEKGPRFGRGAAYASANPHHLLNVRAANMSAFVEQPAHFIEWLRRQGVAPEGAAFVTRDLYGRYLQSILRRSTGGESGARLVLEHDEVVGLEREAHDWKLRLAVGRTLTADVVVLALGNLPPAPPSPADRSLVSSPRYVADPWAFDPGSAAADGDVLLLGTGLTAIDVALSISQARPAAKILALSRHGLTPRRHGEGPPATPAASAAPTGSPTEVLRDVRGWAADDWRAAIDALRPHVSAIWRAWSIKERRSFLTHLRPWWDVYRHRMAPAVADRIEALEAAGSFAVAAGRLIRLDADPAGVEAAWIPRGGGREVSRRLALVVNCQGPRAALAASGQALIDDILERGLIRADRLGLGFDVDLRSRVIARDGTPSDTLYAVGPTARGGFFEITSVPDIRIQAADCASAIQNVLGLRARARPAPEGRLAADLAAFLRQSMDELEVELASLKFARRVRNAWELRGRRAAFGQILLWLESRRSRGGER